MNFELLPNEAKKKLASMGITDHEKYQEWCLAVCQDCFKDVIRLKEIPDDKYYETITNILSRLSRWIFKDSVFRNDVKDARDWYVHGFTDGKKADFYKKKGLTPEEGNLIISRFGNIFIKEQTFDLLVDMIKNKKWLFYSEVVTNIKDPDSVIKWFYKITEDELKEIESFGIKSSNIISRLYNYYNDFELKNIKEYKEKILISNVNELTDWYLILKINLISEIINWVKIIDNDKLDNKERIEIVKLNIVEKNDLETAKNKIIGYKSEIYGRGFVPISDEVKKYIKERYSIGNFGGGDIKIADIFALSKFRENEISGVGNFINFKVYNEKYKRNLFWMLELLKEYIDNIGKSNIEKVQLYLIKSMKQSTKIKELSINDFPDIIDRKTLVKSKSKLSSLKYFFGE